MVSGEPLSLVILNILFIHSFIFLRLSLVVATGLDGSQPRLLCTWPQILAPNQGFLSQQ